MRSAPDRTRPLRSRALRARAERLLALLADHPVWTLSAWTAALAVPEAGHRTAVGWHSFVTGTQVLFSGSAGHLLAEHSALQIGPVTYVVIAPLVLGLPAAAARLAAMTALAALGVAIVVLAGRLAPVAGGRHRQRLLLAGLAALPLWMHLAVGYAHADDALALLFGVAAMWLTNRGRPLAAAALLALAADCKPWAVVFVPILLLDERHRLRAAAVYAGTIAAAWLPFFVLDPRSGSVATYRIANAANSSLRALGVDSARTPLWDRPAQFALGIGLGVLAWRRGRWEAILLVGVAARLLLDPSTKVYYDAGLAIGAVVVDVVSGTSTWPLATAGVLALFSLPRTLLAADPALYGWIRTSYLVGLVIALLGIRPRGPVDDGPPNQPGEASSVGQPAVAVADWHTATTG